MFDYFDTDKDNLISYKDFVMSIGYEIHPSEGLYFRQDRKQNVRQTVCAQKGCWQACKGSQAYCEAHLKLNLSKIGKLYQNIFDKINRNYPEGGWGKFIVALKRKATFDDPRFVRMEGLLEVLAHFKLRLLDKQISTITNLYRVEYGIEPGLINIKPILDLRRKQRQADVYGKVPVEENPDT